VIKHVFSWSALKVKVYLDAKQIMFKTNFITRNKIINHIFEKQIVISRNLYLKINTAAIVYNYGKDNNYANKVMNILFTKFSNTSVKVLYYNIKLLQSKHYNSNKFDIFSWLILRDVY
jgi:hypothetical protein